MTLEIRPARAEDREAVLAFCERTWGEYGDYIEQAWDAWLNDEQGVFLVGLLEGQPVAIEKVSLSSPTEVWLEGMRVHPDHRKKGIATALFQHAMNWARDNRIRLVRLSTASTNTAVHRMIEPAGLRHVLTAIYYVGEALVEAEPSAADDLLSGIKRLSTAAAAEVWASLQRWGGLQRNRWLYAYDWAWQPLTQERLAAHLQAGQVWCVRDERGALHAVATAQEQEEDPDDGLVVGLLDGEEEGLKRLALALRVLAQECTPPKVESLVWEEKDLLQTLEAAGYRRGLEAAFWIFEGTL